MINQQKYLLKSFLILVLITGSYFVVKKLYNSKRFTKPVSLENADIIFQKQDSSVIMGEKLFHSCRSCHGIFKNFTGPALAGVSERWPDKKEMLAFIQNPPKVIARNAYAKKLKDKFSSISTAFPDLTEKQLQNILDYIKYEEKKGTKPEAAKKAF